MVEVIDMELAQDNLDSDLQNILQAQTDAWRADKCPSIEEYCNSPYFNGNRSFALPYLIFNEYECRKAKGEKPSPNEYCNRFPEIREQLQFQFAMLDSVEKMLNPGATEPPTYIVEHVLGRGGMGIVYYARDKTTKRAVALKALLPGHKHQEIRERFLREAELLAAIDHPNVVPIFSVSQEPAAIAMKYIHGSTLAEAIKCVTYPAKDAAKLVKQLADAVSEVHKKRIVHRDLKPSNVMLAENNDNVTKRCPVLIDFGLAKQLKVSSELTETDVQGIGTLVYMAPEQFRSFKEVGPAADIYSLGVILYELLCGRVPHSPREHEPPLEFIVRTEKTTPEPPSKLNSTIDRDLDTICLRCLEKDPKVRLQAIPDAKALSDHLQRFEDDQPSLLRPVTRTELIRKWCSRNPEVAGSLATIVLSLSVALIVSIGFGLASRRDAAEAKRLEGVAEEQAELARSETERANGLKKLADDKAEAAISEATENRRLLDLSRLREAQAAWDRGQVQVARDWLAEVDPKNRCLAWRLLNNRFEGSLFTLDSHAGRVSSVAISYDGGLIVTGTSEGTALIWNGRTGETITILREHKGRVNSVAISADGRRVVTGSMDGVVRVWDSRTGQAIAEFQGHTGEVRSVAISADGSRVVSGSGSLLLGLIQTKVWDSHTGKILHDLGGDEFVEKLVVISVAISTDGSRVVRGRDRGIEMSDIRTGQPVTEYHDTRSVWAMAVSADVSRMVTRSTDGAIWVRDGRTGQPVTVLRGHTEEVLSVAIAADGSRVVTGSKDGVVRVWDSRTGQAIAELRGHVGPVSSVAISADGSRIVTGSTDGTARVWDGRTGQRIPELRGHAGPVSSVAISADGSRIVTGSTDGTARVWDGRTGLTIAELRGTGPVSSVAISADGSQVVTCGIGGNGFFDFPHTRVWDARTGRLLRDLEPRDFPGRSVAISADGSRVIAVDGIGIRIWDGGTSQAVNKYHNNRASVHSVAISADGSRFVTGSSDGTTLVWDARTGQPVTTLRGHAEEVLSVAISADGSRVATGSTDGTARVWDGRTGLTIAELRGVDKARFPLAISADGSRVVTGSKDGVVRVWDSRTGQAIAELRGHVGPVSSVAISADGSQVVTGDGGGVAIVQEAVFRRRLPAEPITPPIGLTDRTFGDQSESCPRGSHIVVWTAPNMNERLRRLWLSRPIPEWHTKREGELAAERNPYGAALQRSFAAHARGVVEFETGNFVWACASFLRAEVLRPPIPRILDLAPSPRLSSPPLDARVRPEQPLPSAVEKLKS
jgi:WD40 repeat protein/serine/threonine protein kinase